MNKKNNLFKLFLAILFGVCSFTSFAEGVGQKGELEDCGASTEQTLSREAKGGSSGEEINAQGEGEGSTEK